MILMAILFLEVLGKEPVQTHRQPAHGEHVDSVHVLVA